MIRRHVQGTGAAIALATVLALCSVQARAQAPTTGPGGAAQRNFSLEGAVIDSRSSRSLGVVSEKGDLASLFRAQKAMTFGILRSAGISLEQLTPELRARIERFQTTNVEAFRAFSQGLDLKDQGKFAEARDAFRRAAELDPNFTLAAEQQQAMPDVNLGGNVQVRAVIAATAGAAIDRAKASFTVDVNRAVAALQAGQTVIAVAAPPTEQSQTTAATGGYTSNPAGSGTQYLPAVAAGLSYSYANSPTSTLNVASVNEWPAGKYQVSGGTLVSVGGSGGDFAASKLNATASPAGSVALSDGSTVYWGSWLSTPGGSATVTVSGTALSAPTLGRVDYMFGDATRQMPTTNTAVFTPAGGSTLGQVGGDIAVNFATRSVTLNGLGFTVDGLVFSGLTGNATYDARIASGFFAGNYSGGNCVGCPGFAPQSSVFNGAFVGAGANGLVFSTILLTGSGTASGVHLFRR